MLCAARTMAAANMQARPAVLVVTDPGTPSFIYSALCTALKTEFAVSAFHPDWRHNSFPQAVDLLTEELKLMQGARFVAHGVGACVLWQSFRQLNFSNTPSRCVLLAPSSRSPAADWVDSVRPFWLRLGVYPEPAADDASWDVVGEEAMEDMLQRLQRDAPAATTTLALTSISIPPAQDELEHEHQTTDTKLADSKPGWMASPSGCDTLLSQARLPTAPSVVSTTLEFLKHGATPV